MKVVFFWWFQDWFVFGASTNSKVMSPTSQSKKQPQPKLCANMEMLRRRDGQRSVADVAQPAADPESTAGASAVGGAERGADAAESSAVREEPKDLQIIGQELVKVDGDKKGYET